MRTLGLIGLAALFASTASVVNAKPVTISFDGLCDTMTLTPDKALRLYGSYHLAGCPGAKPSSNPIPGIGIIVKSNGPKRMEIGETQPDGTGTPVGYMYELQFPLVTGGTWTLYGTSDGVVIDTVSSGTYTVK